MAYTPSSLVTLIQQSSDPWVPFRERGTRRGENIAWRSRKQCRSEEQQQRWDSKAGSQKTVADDRQGDRGSGQAGHRGEACAAAAERTPQPPASAGEERVHQEAKSREGAKEGKGDRKLRQSGPDEQAW